MTLVRWNPWAGPLARRSEFDTLVDHLFNETFGAPVVSQDWVPAVDVRDTGDSFIVHAEVPGLSRDDIKVTLQEGVLTLEGDKRSERREGKESDSFYRIERRYGRFSRSFRLPAGVQADKVRADYKDGVLTITVPKAEAVKPRTIEIAMN